jgi:hypothetical protein
MYVPKINEDTFNFLTVIQIFGKDFFCFCIARGGDDQLGYCVREFFPPSIISFAIILQTSCMFS